MRSLHEVRGNNGMDDRRMLMDLKDMLRLKTEKIEQLKRENEWLKADIEALKIELESEKKRLRDAAGAWGRKAQGKGGKRECLREGYHHERQWHYKVYVVTDIPKDLDIEEVCLTLKETFLPTVYPYRFLRCDYSTKYEGWMVEVVKDKIIDMSYSSEEKRS
jgi:hypothetical protein